MAHPVRTLVETIYNENKHDVAKIELKAVSVKDFQHGLQEREQGLCRCVALKGNI